MDGRDFPTKKHLLRLLVSEPMIVKFLRFKVSLKYKKIILTAKFLQNTYNATSVSNGAENKCWLRRKDVESLKCFERQQNHFYGVEGVLSFDIPKDEAHVLHK